MDLLANLAAGVVVGQSVTGAGIPVGATVTAVSGNTVTLSAATSTAITAGTTITFGAPLGTMYSNTYSGTTYVNAGTLQLGNGGTGTGGTLGGISSGQDLRVSIAIKPTSSILIPRPSIDTQGNEVEVLTKGRHDPCVGIRATPIAEAMLALVVMDHALRHRAQCADVKVSAKAIPSARPGSKTD